ncbi:MAG: class I SAM-dependent methyltransferase [Thermodesulfobacteriota bacterium]|nr:class I SAM-dependent methyltransferase [Deltaproteobacteria bacterium]MDI6753221.1 class I SAM-dependent methyltransferase [Thermodesulfobacteriota bacterium]
MKAWDEIWKTKEGRSRFLVPDAFVVSLITNFKEEGIRKILDLGFGLGRHAILFAQEDFEVYGIDTSPEGLKCAMEWSKKENLFLHLELGEMSHLSFGHDFFDLILAWNVLYHGTSDFIYQTLREIKRCLRGKGYLLCTLISQRHSKYGWGKEVEEGTFVIEGEIEKSHPHHYFKRDEINQYLAGFQILKCEDKEQQLPGSFHWHILARLDSKWE